MGRRTKRERPRKAATLIEIPAISLEQMTGSDTLPVSVVNIGVDGKQRGFLFVMTKAARDGYDDANMRVLAQTIGNLVHPFPATIVSLPRGAEDLKVFEVVA